MKKKKSANFLDLHFERNPEIRWERGDDGVVTLYMENRGLFNTIAQKFFKKPRFTQVHLEEMGSFIYPIIDSEKDVYELGKQVSEHLGEKAEPLYERLSTYMGMLEDYGFIRRIQH